MNEISEPYLHLFVTLLGGWPKIQIRLGPNENNHSFILLPKTIVLGITYYYGNLTFIYKCEKKKSISNNCMYVILFMLLSGY